MKRIASFKFVIGIAKLTCCIIWLAGILRAESESLPYHFIRFEENQGYQAGDFRGIGGGLQLLQGGARIARDHGNEAGQYLETVAGNPYASIHFHGERVSRNHKTYYEIWVRPSASPLANSEEFMDLDGAILGFFADASDGPATFHAYHALPEQTGYWVSTGVSAAVGPTGMTQEWIRIGICQNLATGNWDLEIGGEVVMTEIRSTTTPREDGIQLWLLGHETRANLFDDLLISPVNPDSLRLGETKHLPQGRSTKNGNVANLLRSSERKVSRKQSDEDRRRHDFRIPDGMAKIAPKILKFEIDVIEGGTQHGKFKDESPDAKYQSIMFYSPQYDDSGNPLPLKIRIQCDAELAIGVDLSKILWVVTKVPETEDKVLLQAIDHGNFSTGFSQIAEIPSQLANKACQIEVGKNIVITKSP